VEEARRSRWRNRRTIRWRDGSGDCRSYRWTDDFEKCGPRVSDSELNQDCDPARALFALGIWGVWLCLQTLKGLRYYAVLLVMGILGSAMLWDVLKKRYVLFVTARDGRLHKLSFSVAAYPADIEVFLQKVRQTFGLEIQSDVADIKT
jgi:hypothetical protein